MFILPKEDFIEEIKAEMAGYEEITKELIDDWVKRFNAYAGSKHVMDRRIQVKGAKVNVKLQDESDLFGIVDRYFSAIDQDDLEAYWTDWKL